MILEYIIIVIYSIALVLIFMYAIAQLNLLFNYLKASNEDIQNKITKNLRCLICQGQSVYDSDSEFANSLKILVKKKLNDGLSEKQIYEYFKDNIPDVIILFAWNHANEIIEKEKDSINSSVEWITHLPDFDLKI